MTEPYVRAGKINWIAKGSDVGVQERTLAPGQTIPWHYHTAITDTISIAAGVSGLKGRGFHPGVAATKPTLQWSDSNENGTFDLGEIQTTTGSAAQPSSNFNRFALGFDLRLAMAIPTVGLATIYGEVYQAKNLDRAILPADPNGLINRDYRELGAYVAGTLDVTDLGSIRQNLDQAWAILHHVQAGY